MDQVAVEARLQDVLDVRQCIEVEGEQTFSETMSDTISDSAWKEESHDALAVSSRMRLLGGERQEAKERDSH
ncbi:hypothetical protein E4U43_007259 [Claviceps pusilla]|uniref:Uncharacterized protein n=1 Tax=Claviceps pusilla TaxID=123648 RepID=A0A9P7T138_9HYPO|nr:hypothetical protein E4U43_007259 [Claviceps pusilla]